MSESVEAVQADIRNMSENIAHMRTAVDNMARQLQAVAVLEEKHNNHDTALSRAFNEIKRVEQELEDHAAADAKEHDFFKRSIWFMSGMAFAVSILWTVFGVYVADTVRDNTRVVNQMQLHVLDKSAHRLPQ